MITSRRIWAIALLGTIELVGCHASSPSGAHTDTSPYVRRETPSRSGGDRLKSTLPPDGKSDVVSAQPPEPGTAQALALRARSYAQTVEPLVDRRPTARRTADDSHWPDPDALRLTVQQPSPAAGSSTSGDGSKAAAPDAAALSNTGATIAAAAAPAGHEHATPLPAPSAPASAQLAGAPAVASVSSDLFAAQLARKAADFSADLSAQLDNQFLKLIRDESVPDLQALAGLAPEDRELLGALMDSLTNFRNQIRQGGNMLFSNKIRPLIDLSDRLRSQAELSVPTVALCKKVQAFGTYDEISPARFVAGQDHDAIVYCEVENFMSQVNNSGAYETRLTEDVVLYTEASGLPVWSDPKSTCVDDSRRRRHDFIVVKRIRLPHTLTIGRYLLKVTIEDQQARRIAENTLPIEIVAQ